MPNVSVVIPVYNKWELTEACLASLAATTSGLDVEVVVVDNASTDATPAQAPELGARLFGDRFRFLRQERNVNFGPACNAGAWLSASALLFFLNNDTILLDGWLEPLLAAFADEPRLGAAGPLLLYPDSGRVQHLGVVYYVGLGAAHLHHKISGESRLARRRREFQALTGAALMVPANLFRELDGFHPGFVNGCEDLDLCARIKQRGLRMLCVPESRIQHIASQSPGRFEKEAANSSLFRSRCAALVEPDFHAWCRREGMEMRLTPSGQVYMARPAEVSREFAAMFAERSDPLRLWDFLDGEPLWEEGYETLAALLENEELFDEALTVRIFQHAFFPRLEHCRALLALGRKWGNGTVVESAAKAMAWHTDMMRSGRAEMALREQLAYYTRAGEPKLAALCRATLALATRSRRP